MLSVSGYTFVKQNLSCEDLSQKWKKCYDGIRGVEKCEILILASEDLSVSPHLSNRSSHARV